MFTNIHSVVIKINDQHDIINSECLLFLRYIWNNLFIMVFIWV